MSITRTLAAALAIAALTAPTATAYDIHAPLARAAAKAHKNEDQRSPDAKFGAHTPGPPTWPVNAQSITPAKATDSDNGVDWTTIALGIAGSLLAAGGLTAFASRHSRRAQRLRTTG